MKKFMSFVLVVIVFFSTINESLPILEASTVAKYELGGAELYTDNKAIYDAIKDQLPNVGAIKAPPEITLKNGSKAPLNYRLWNQKGILVYGTYRNVPGNRFKCGYQEGIDSQTGFPKEFTGGYFCISFGTYSCNDHGKACPSKYSNTVRGEWQYFGYDLNGNLSSNMWFRNDANLTRFNQREWIIEPWRDTVRAETKLTNGISTFNRAAYDQMRGGLVRQWIGNTLSEWGGVPTLDGLDPEVYKYLYIQSPPTIMHAGSGRMWHQRPNSVWYQTLAVPKLNNKYNPDVSVDTLDVTGDYNASTKATKISLPSDTSEDSDILYIDVRLKGTLKDEAYFGDDVQETIWYTRKDIKSWNFTVTLFGVPYTASNIPINSKSDNTKTYEFVQKVAITYGQLRAIEKTGTVATVTAQPIYDNNTPGKIGTNSFVIGPAVMPARPESALDNIKIVIPTLEIGNNIPEVAFDNIPFAGAVDNTDMSLVTSKELYVGGVQVDYDLFFSGQYVFPRTTDRNGYLTQVEVVYHLNRDAIIAEGVSPEGKEQIMNMANMDFKSVDVVYVYPTKPYAHFSLSSNSWKENRIISVTNDSPSSNIQLVMDRYPITQYRWSYGGDTSKLHYGTNTDLQKQLQYSAPGNYTLTLEAKNSLGQWSDPYTVNFAVLKDYEPNIEVNLTDSVITRQDTIKAWHYGITSTDGDRITAARIELWYDSDNNGTVETKLQEWDGLGGNGISEKDDFPSYIPNKLGYYVYRIYASEDFVGVPGQETLAQFVSPADKKAAYYEVEWWVDNYQPLSDIYINAPIERPKVDLLIMLDKNLDDTKRDTVIKERVSIENFLLGQNLIPNVSIWNMKTYVYSQGASTNKNTGSTYPPATVQYESNGYAGTLTRKSVSDNGGYHDFGHWSSQTETRYFADSHTNNCTTTYSRAKKTDSWTQTGNYESSPAPSSKSVNTDGFVGSIPRTSTSTNYYNDTVSSDGLSRTISASYTAYYGGNVSKTVSVWVPNLQWVANYTGTYEGTIYKSVRQPYTDPYNGQTHKYILYISDDTITELDDYNTAISKSDAEVMLAGKTEIKSQSQHDLYIDVTGKTVTQIIDEALEYIKNESPAVEQIYVLPGQTFTLNLAEFDLENDAIIDRQLQYVHEANHFDNPTGQEPDTLAVYNPETGWTTTVRDHFNNVGKYRIYRRVKDLPAGSIGSNYAYYSGATEVNIYVHRKPIADATLDWYYNPDTGVCETVWVDKSYDLDHTSMETKGIVDRKIMFRRNGGEWQYYIPDTLTYGTYDVRYFVQDLEGAWSDPWIKTFTLDGNPQFTASARAKDSSFTLASIPAGETIEAYNLWTRQPSPLRLEFSLTPTVSSLPALKTIAFQNNITGTQTGQDIRWFNQDLQIPEIFPDGPRTFSVTARDINTGFATQIPFSVTVFTPINLAPGIAEQTLNTGVPSMITATTTKYPSATTVIMQRGTPYQSAAMSMTGTVSGNSKRWSLNYTIPASVPDGTYTARFVSTNPSGKTETKDVTYQVVRNRPPVLTITGTSPPFIYEGDDVSINFMVSDPDLDAVTCDIRIKQGPATVWAGSKIVTPSGGIYPSVSIPTIQNIVPGSFTVEITARDPYNATGYSSYSFTARLMSIVGDVLPNPAMAGERLTITASTEGYSERVLVSMWNGDIIELYPVNSTTNLNNTWTGSYIVPLHTPDATYPVNFTAIRGSIERQYSSNLTILGNLLNLVRPRIRDSN